MRHFRTTCAVSALIAALAQGAAADVTAEEAWGSLRDILAGSGYDGAATETREGDALVVSDTVFTMTVPETGGSTAIDFGTLRFVEQGDGTVRVEMPDVMPVTSSFTDPETGTPMTVVVDIIQAAPSLVMSGDADAITQAYAADTVDVALKSIDTPGDEIPADAIRMAMSFAGLTSTTTLGPGELRPMDMTASVDSASFDMAFEVPGQGNGAASGEMAGLTFEGEGMMPTSSSGGDLYAMMQAGYEFAGTFAHDAAALTLSGEEDGQAFTAELTSAEGTIDMAMTGDALSYNLVHAASTVTAMVAQLPFPLTIEAEGLKAGLTLPLSEGPEPKDFALMVNLDDFEMSDMIWMMFDPQSILPRDPATLLVDLAGKATVLANLLDPAVATQLEQTGEAPGQLEELDIRALELDMVGARLAGTGSFTFDNDDTETFNGMPRPVGELNLQLTGGNALVDKLSQMGLIGPQEAGSARMMMGLLAVPGTEPDTLNSKLEINEQGHISANGQRIQ